MIYAENILICIAIPLLVSLLFVRGEVRRYLAAFLFGMGVCLLAAYISSFLGDTVGMTENDTAVYLSPVVEELMKLLPLGFFTVMIAPKERRQTMLAVAVGAGFATFENCCYILSYGAEDLSYVMIRGMSVGVMHLVCALTLVFGLTSARRFRVLSLPAVIGAISLSMVFHGLYNMLVSKPGLSSVIGYAMPVITAVAIYFPFHSLIDHEPGPEQNDTDNYDAGKKFW